LKWIVRALLERFSNVLCLACSLACRRGGGERCVKGNSLIAPPRLPRLKQVRGKSETFSYRKGLRAARGANNEPVGRPQSCEIKFNCAIDNALRDMRILFQFGIVTRCQEARPATPKVINDCRCERRPFCGIGARPRFIKKNQIACLGGSMDSQDGGQVPREGGEALRDGLVVTNICPKTARWRDPWAGVGGYWESRVVRRDKQADGFECDCLPTCVWSSDEEYPLSVIEFKVNGYDPAEQEGVSCTDKDKAVIAPRCCKVPISLCRNISRCPSKIYVGKELNRNPQHCRTFAYKRA
jgi:hypothetical protein